MEIFWKKEPKVPEATPPRCNVLCNEGGKHKWGKWGVVQERSGRVPPLVQSRFCKNCNIADMVEVLTRKGYFES